MRTKLHSWWQQIKHHWVAILIVAILLIVAIALIIVGYRFEWTGFNGNSKAGKTLWDWLQLLIIPIMLIVGGFWLNQIQKSRDDRVAQQRIRAEREAVEQRAETEREIAEDNQRETALQGYIDKMSELLLHEKLRESQQTDEVRTIARVRTLTLLYRLGGRRKGSVLQFLHESNLIDQDKSIISLDGAYLRGLNLLSFDLTGANLYKADLFEADLRGSILKKANLIEADLREAKLSGADLSRSELMGANLGGANLSGANLCNSILREANLAMADLGGADLTGTDLLAAKADPKQLDQAGSLKGTTMPDGSIHS